MPKKHVVQLTEDEREELFSAAYDVENPPTKRKRAQILLLSDRGKTDLEIVRLLKVARVTVERTRKKFCEGELHFDD